MNKALLLHLVQFQVQSKNFDVKISTYMMITRFFLSWLLVRHILLQTSRTKINSKPRFTFVYCTI